MASALARYILRNEDLIGSKISVLDVNSTIFFVVLIRHRHTLHVLIKRSFDGVVRTKRVKILRQSSTDLQQTDANEMVISVTAYDTGKLEEPKHIFIIEALPHDFRTKQKQIAQIDLPDKQQHGRRGHLDETQHCSFQYVLQKETSEICCYLFL